MIRQVDIDDWVRLRDVRLRALADSPEAFLEPLAIAESFPESHWQDRATPRPEQAAFVLERDGSFEGMVGCFVADDPENVFLVSMWVAPEQRGTGVAELLVIRIVGRARARDAVRGLLSVCTGNAS